MQEEKLKGKELAEHLFGDISTQTGQALTDIVYDLAEEDFDHIEGLFYVGDYPKRGERSYSDPEYVKECEEYRSNYNKLRAAFLEENGYEHIMSEGGGEGGSEDCEGVFKWKGKFYHTCWEYYSHEGTRHDCCDHYLSEVTPSQKTITVYT